MSRSASDHPRVVVFPPLIPIVTIGLGFLLQWLVPLPLPAGVAQSWRMAIGAAAFAAGALVCVVAASALVRRGTTVSPSQPSTVLATEGIYRWTRNPIYVGGTLAMVGIGLVFGLAWLAPLLVPSMLAMHFGIVRPEEQYLEDKFGDEYRRYKARVPRYVASI